MSSDNVVNLAPYSFFNAVAARPPMVMFASEGIKDSIRNVEATGEFVVNLATEPLAHRMNETSMAFDPLTNEFEASGLTMAPSRLVKPPRVAESPVALECKVTRILPLEDLNGNAGERRMAIGEVVGIYIGEEYLTNGLFDMVKARTIARCGYFDYTEVTELFGMRRPKSSGH